MTPDWLIDRFDGLDCDPEGLRGDHDLNPGMRILPDLTPAAVLIPLVERETEITTLFTQRTSHLKHHAGQISFPGGHSDPEDTSAEDTALRETEEEVGLHRSRIRVIGRLAPYITRTGFSVIPVVGLVTPPFDIESGQPSAPQARGQRHAPRFLRHALSGALHLGGHGRHGQEPL